VKRAVIAVLVTCAALACLAAPALAADAYPGMEHLHFAAGPYRITPGANLILLDTNHVPKPNQDGYMVRVAPNLRYATPSGKCCGRIPRVDVIHLHHGVWLSNGAAGAGEGNSFGSLYPFMASGEEKTVYEFPHGYGYPVGASDTWILNYMIHNLTSKAAQVYITYDIDFVPATSPAAAQITPAHPIWMDVEDHHLYPVFDVHRHSGVNGKFTFPDMAKNAYPRDSPPLNQFTVDHPGTLIAAAGHLHPGGLYDDLDLIRPATTPAPGTLRGAVPHSVRLFRSSAHYFDKRGPISWDMAMTATPADWRPQVKAGDVMRISTTYDTTRAAWYESMGIMVVWEAWSTDTGTDPFAHPLDERGHTTHGHLAEDDNHGGAYPLSRTATAFPDCSRKTVQISEFQYNPGDFTATGMNRCTPTVTQGHSITFVNDDASPLSPGDPLNPTKAYLDSVFHTVTACANPCGLNTGISYPLANGPGGYDSGQLGLGTPANGKLSWSTPAALKPGTYTFFCRIHPFMRGVFRVIR
jgi:plastocyanin